MKLTTRHLIHGKGRHRATPPTEQIEVSLDHLLGTPWPQPARPYGAAVVQCWDDCPPCGKPTAGILHADGRTCGECLTTTSATSEGGTR
ncbi:hypothetical protein IMX12_13150 [Streptomyces sp. Babs14]|uniref:hypothetical protein n=1 Tax=unclassified Streptomyces TaxID=2593676 RepID=UPI001C24CFA5|nr:MULTISPECIES: hypothetical protein [unclassified Streptomyces]MBU8549756.1 hypothetical protein [Streptomyces sp. Osf17]MBU8556539.1 hypothetical protein [Streptomyces sp. Babs14]